MQGTILRAGPAQRLHAALTCSNQAHDVPIVTDAAPHGAKPCPGRVAGRRSDRERTTHALQAADFSRREVASHPLELVGGQVRQHVLSRWRRPRAEREKKVGLPKGFSSHDLLICSCFSRTLLVEYAERRKIFSIIFNFTSVFFYCEVGPHAYEVGR